MKGHGVAVTGLGAVSSLGPDARSCYETLRAGHGAIRLVEVDSGPHGPGPQQVALARLGAREREHLQAKCRGSLAELMDVFAQLALTSASEALADAALPERTRTYRTAVVLGHGTGGTESLESAYERFFGQKIAKMHPLTIPRAMVSSPASVVAMAHQIHGPVFATSSACSSSGHAIAQAALMIRAGMIDAAVVGGSESATTAGMLRCWEAMRAISRTTCRPFSAQRDGMVLGEGGAALVLERTDLARERGAHVYAELHGEGCTSDAFHLTQPQLDGAVRAIEAATAGHLSERSRVLVSAHGTGTPLNDVNEAAALNQVLGGAGIDFRVTATKSYHGHLLGASSALQVVLALLAASDGVVPPVLNFVERDPECDLPLVTHSPEAYHATHVLANSFAFGGLNVALLFGVPTPR